MDEANELYALYDQAKHMGRNELCWCGSGLKFKKCHLDRARMPEVPLQEIVEQQKRIFERKTCLHADAAPIVCSKVIQAHTLQRRELSKIARNSMVYGIKGDFITRMKTGGSLEIGLTGLRDASTFYGFCGTHDAPTFAALETRPFTSSSEQCFLLAYRAICRELYTKEGQLMMLPFTRTLDRGKPLAAQVEIQYKLRYLQSGVELGLRDLQSYKAQYDEALRGLRVDDMRYYVIQLDRPPDLVCTGGILPEFDFAGRSLQVFTDPHKRPDHIIFSLLPTFEGGAAVFSWLGTSNAGEALVRSLSTIPDVDVPNALIRFALDWFENIFAAPIWWENLEETARARLKSRMESGMRFMDEPSPNDILDDGLRTADWSVIARRTNLVI